MARAPALGMVALALLCAVRAALAEDPLYTTFSIAARDAATGDLGVAVSTMAPAVGSAVPWARAGVGAVATQAWTNPAFGPRGLDLLEEGLPPREVLERLLSQDPQPERRQVGIVSAAGVAASHTGRETIPWAGAIEGAGFTVQGNLLVGLETVQAMADAFRATEGSGLPLAERLLRALEAGQAAGGDRRGRQSAALLVASTDAERARDRANNIRVDDHEDPVGELRRVYDALAGRLGFRALSRPRGEDVRELQRLLARAGIYEGEVSGVFDDATVAAVQAFRRSQKMYAGEHGGDEGLVDAAFLERLRAHLSERSRERARRGTP